MAEFTLNVNGSTYRVNVAPDTPLLWVLRDALGLTGTKYGCGKGLCGTCTVHLGGRAERSCVTPVSDVGESRITTIEGLGQGQPDGLHPVQRAWIEEHVPQCGYCQPGQIMTAAALLAAHPIPTEQQVDAAMSGVLCRCGTYLRIRRAIRRAAGEGGG
jgi:isoquinoline 1-oxidoreductase alpha subunit